MSARTKLVVLALIVALATFAAAQEKVIHKVPVKPVSAADGKVMYMNYCAVCHGKAGKGDGPAAEALKVAPPDLTMLAKKNNGEYPAIKVASTIRGEANLPAHGSKDMPVWGKLFRSMSQGHEAEVQQRVTNLTDYIKEMQAK
jgi:mono/diheme cytochrome c family protein